MEKRCEGGGKRDGGWRDGAGSRGGDRTSSILLAAACRYLLMLCRGGGVKGELIFWGLRGGLDRLLLVDLCL